MADVDIAMIDADISVTSMGDIMLVGGDGELIQSVINKMKIVFGEWFGNQNIGNMVSLRRLKLNDSAMRQVEYDCRVAILQDQRVIDVPYIRATRVDGYTCTVDFQIKKSDGSVIGSNTLIVLMG